MARPGRRPKPTAIRQLQGNPGKRPLPRGEVRPEAGGVRMPRGLLTKYARRLWRDLAPKLEGLGVLTEVDEAALVLLCQHWGIAVEAGRRLIDREGGELLLTESTVMGGTKKHPLLQVFKENSQMFRMYAEQFGLTPSARGRLSVPEPEQLSLADALFAVVRGAEGEGEVEDE